MTTTTNRLKLPLLEIAQAQKEMTHNEALALLDVAIQPVVEAIAPASVPLVPLAGQCWIVGAVPTGEWTGHADSLAAWTAGGWRFVAPFDGMKVWSIADGMGVQRIGSEWTIGKINAATLTIGGQQVVGARKPAIVAPTGGTTIDLQAREAVAAILARLVSHGLIS